MEAETAALRAALATLDTLEQQLDQAGYDPWPYERHPLRDLRQVITSMLRDHEMQLWTRAGLPEVPRGRA